MVLGNPRRITEPWRVKDENRVGVAPLVRLDVVSGDFLRHRLRRIFTSLIDDCVAEIVLSLHSEAVSDKRIQQCRFA